MVGAPESPAPTPPGGPPSTFLSIDGGCSRIFSSASSALAPPEGPPSMFLSVDGGCSRITSSGTSRGPPSMFLSTDGGRSPTFSSNWPHLWIRSLSRCGPGGLCRYPKDRVTPYTSSKSRQGARRASTCCHISCSFGPHHPTEVGSGTTTCPAAPDLASLLR
jgi:hypothetical protein